VHLVATFAAAGWAETIHASIPKFTEIIIGLATMMITGARSIPAKTEGWCARRLIHWVCGPH